MTVEEFKSELDELISQLEQSQGETIKRMEYTYVEKDNGISFSDIEITF